jgi:predicted anti-sigma-YlaC factor YlaD
MRLISFYDWIRRIYATHEDELGCDEVFELLSAYVDKELAGDMLPPHAREIEQHLKQCPYCYDLYVGLRDAAALESEESVPVAVLLERYRPR